VFKAWSAASFLEQRIGSGINVVDAAVLVIRNPDQESSGKVPIVAKSLAGFPKVHGNLFEQEFWVTITATDRSAFDLQILDEDFNIFRRNLRIENEVKVDTRSGFYLLVEDDIVHPAFHDRQQSLTSRVGTWISIAS
jgi:hypothetical protein